MDINKYDDMSISELYKELETVRDEFLKFQMKSINMGTNKSEEYFEQISNYINLLNQINELLRIKNLENIYKLDPAHVISGRRR